MGLMISNRTPTGAAAFIDSSRVDALLRGMVPDDQDRAFVVRCILGEGPAHHRGANYAILMLLGAVVDALRGADMDALRAKGTIPVPMKVSPHLARPGSFMAYPLDLPTGPLERLAPAGSTHQAAMAECLTDGPPQHALANAAMIWLIGAALEQLEERNRGTKRTSVRPRSRPPVGGRADRPSTKPPTKR
jgi:hypothetical protein